MPRRVASYSPVIALGRGAMNVAFGSKAPFRGRCRHIRSRTCLHNHTTCDTAPGIASRIAFVVVHPSMDYDRCAIGAENRVRRTLLQRNRSIEDLHHQLTALWNVKIRHVTSMVALECHEAMLLAARVEMAAGGVE